MKKILNVPYISQYRDIQDKDWQRRGCGVVCLKTVLDFYGVAIPKLDDFIKLALERKAFGENGWRHDRLVEIADSFGLKADRKEFKFENALAEKGIVEIAKFLKQGQPVIVSVAKKFKYPDKFHQVVLTGFENDENGKIKGFYYNDSDYQNENDGKNIFVPIQTFKKYWRKLAIFICKKKR